MRGYRMIRRIGIGLGGLILLGAGSATAFPSYGTFVDTTCTASGLVPAKPFNPNGGNPNSASQVNCGLCHTNASSPNGNLTTAGDTFRRSGHTDVAPFCAAPVANRPPTFSPVGAQNVLVGQLLALSIVAQDPDGNAILLTVANAPTGSTFTDAGNGSGSFRWTPTSTQLGAHTLTFHAADTGTPMATANLDVAIAVGQAANLPPVLAPIGNQQLDPGMTLAFTLSATDPEGQALSYSATGLPLGAQLVGANFSWTPDASQIGQHPVTFRVADSGTPVASDSESVVISVGRINRPPVLAPIGNRQGPVGSELRVMLTATDPDLDAIVLSCTGLPVDATLTDHGDGSAEIVWLPSAAARADMTCSATDIGTPPESDLERFVLSAVDAQTGAAPMLDEAVWSLEGDGGKLSLRGTLPTPPSALRSSPTRTGARLRRVELDVFAVLSDGSTVLLGSGQGTRGGRFRITLEPFMAPCSVAVGSGGVTGEAMAVRNAPAGCDTDLLTRARARLSCDESQLDVSGTRGPLGGQVVISDEDGGERLGSFPVSNRSGRFEGSIGLTSTPSALVLGVEVGESSWMLDEPLSVQRADDCEDEDRDEDLEDDDDDDDDDVVERAEVRRDAVRRHRRLDD